MPVLTGFKDIAPDPRKNPNTEVFRVSRSVTGKSLQQSGPSMIPIEQSHYGVKIAKFFEERRICFPVKIQDNFLPKDNGI
jgi:hypothetical protein